MPNSKKIQTTLLAGFFALSLASPAIAQMEEESDFDDAQLMAALPDGPELAVEDGFEMPLPPPEVMAQLPDGPGFPPGASAFMSAMRDAIGAGGPGGPGGHHHRGGGPFKLLSDENALTDDQYEQLYQLRNKMRDEMGPLRLEYSTASRQLKDALTQESIDRSAVNKLQKKIGSLKSSMSDISIASKADMANVLTAAQRKELRKAMMKMSVCPIMGGGHHHKRWGGGKGCK